jgi:hypothetical protein
MLQALLYGKLNKEFKRSPFSIEDLLTSVVFGSCEYCSPYDIRVITNFLGKAINIEDPLDKLAKDLEQIDQIEYSFWPRLYEPLKVEEVEIGIGEPELVLRMKRKGLPDSYFLLEMKLDSGKSSFATEDSLIIQDQLAKYWVRLKSFAGAKNGTALAIIYVTAHISPPLAEIRETQDELRKLNQETAPLYWVSWRQFEVEPDAPKILRDVAELLQTKWMLFPVAPMKKWSEFAVIDWPQFWYQSSWTFALDFFKVSHSPDYKASWNWPKFHDMPLWNWS